MSSALWTTQVDDRHPDNADTRGTSGDVGGPVDMKNIRSTVSATKSDSELLRQSPTFDDSDPPAVYVLRSINESINQSIYIAQRHNVSNAQ